MIASLSGQAARFVARERPEIPMYVVTPSERVVHQLNLVWGLQAFHLPKIDSVPKLIEESLSLLRDKKLLDEGDEIVMVAGEPLGESGSVNLVELRKV